MIGKDLSKTHHSNFICFTICFNKIDICNKVYHDSNVFYHI